MARNDPALELLGITVESSDETTSAYLTVQAQMLNSHGVCHGGVLFLLADAAMDYASNQALYSSAEVEASFAANAEIDYFMPALLNDELVCTAKISHEWGRAKMLDATIVRVSTGDTIAVFRGRTRSPRPRKV